MALVVLLSLVLLAVAEIYVIVQVAGGIGVLATVLLLIGVSVLGIWLVKLQGLVTFNRFRRRAMAGELPTAELVDGLVVLLAGGLLLLPGFITDIVGIVLLLPPVRAVVRRILLKRFRINPPTVTTRWVRFGDAIDVDGRAAPRPSAGDPGRGRELGP